MSGLVIISFDDMSPARRGIFIAMSPQTAQTVKHEASYAKMMGSTVDTHTNKHTVYLSIIQLHMF